MNSTIINEQRNGKQPDDLMAGLCRSIIENVFTKVVRIANVSELGDRVVVQGGTFRNFAVLRALEEYLGREVTLAPYPGEMGALGAALAVKQEVEAHGYANGHCSAFIGFDAVKDFHYTRGERRAVPPLRQPLQPDHFAVPGRGLLCHRKPVRPGRRGDGRGCAHQKTEEVPDLFRLRQELLFKTYRCLPCGGSRARPSACPGCWSSGTACPSGAPSSVPWGIR